MTRLLSKPSSGGWRGVRKERTCFSPSCSERPRFVSKIIVSFFRNVYWDSEGRVRCFCSSFRQEIRVESQYKMVYLQRGVWKWCVTCFLNIDTEAYRLFSVAPPNIFLISVRSTPFIFTTPFSIWSSHHGSILQARWFRALLGRPNSSTSSTP